MARKRGSEDSGKSIHPLAPPSLMEWSSSLSESHCSSSSAIAYLDRMVRPCLRHGSRDPARGFPTVAGSPPQIVLNVSGRRHIFVSVFIETWTLKSEDVNEYCLYMPVRHDTFDITVLKIEIL
ncbi:hypothetical protein CEXT_302301 [Caerostris extrusa]|uniref:Uncharacterized protein n=1 Tax=Caerostris extrusa TaxID=172846 RepID=A0AAV4U9V1_CAEEX|nr:hypothetical protein CEXT_302301 [Caerostris extrusa]